MNIRNIKYGPVKILKPIYLDYGSCFFNKVAILTELNGIKKGSLVTIDMSKSFTIDYDVFEIIDNFEKISLEKVITVELISRGTKEIFEY